MLQRPGQTQRKPIMAEKFYQRPLFYGLLALLCAVAVYWAVRINTGGQSPATGSLETIPVSDDMEIRKQAEVHLYFADRENAFLNSEQKMLFETDET